MRTDILHRFRSCDAGQGLKRERCCVYCIGDDLRAYGRIECGFSCSITQEGKSAGAGQIEAEAGACFATGAEG